MHARAAAVLSVRELRQAASQLLLWNVVKDNILSPELWLSVTVSRLLVQRFE